MTNNVPVVHVVRADGGRYAQDFLSGGYIGIGFIAKNLSQIEDKDALRILYQAEHSSASPLRVGQNVGQIWRFLKEVEVDTYVITPTEDNDSLMVGRITGPYTYITNPTGSHFHHRKPVTWFDEPLLRNTLSIPAQNTLRSTLAVFRVPQYEEILSPYKVSLPREARKTMVTEEAITRLILDRLLELSADEFEIFVTELLTAIRFEAKHVGKSGDGGVDVEGTLRIYEFATVDLKVQAKRYKSGRYVNHKDIKGFRSSVAEKAQAAFVTTSDFNGKAREEAEKPDFKRIGLINGNQLAGILVENYDSLSAGMKEKLNLQKTLIPLE
ncbi:MAG: restriction endonuclease [Chloroflexi bacterium]|nr:restriction endonuclease [Chloroflexota bacterium]MCI0646656.1 restriction endonuclease [Chloroflexota bacterium]MCI0729236.1 restriction endonuclease [Chloroflexota bacterium]